MIVRRNVLQGLAVTALAGCAGQRTPMLPPIRATEDRIFDITVCLRPFRAQGPRLEAASIGGKRVIFHYGHGGSGWSLSWGSAAQAVRMAMADSPREIAVIGCGAIGLTTAITAQQAGAKVTIYAQEMLPRTRSARATGSWTPSSRIALISAAAPGFAAQWEQMARASFKNYRNYLGLPGTPVEWRDQYFVLNETLDAARSRPAAPGTLDFANYGDRIADLRPDPMLLPAGERPFDAPFVYRTSAMHFNLASYGHTLLADFHEAGGISVRRVFRSAAEIAEVKENTIIACPGYGARALFGDTSLVPVRGQLAWLPPQQEVNYGVLYKDVFALPRSDGIVVQDLASGDMKGYGDGDEAPDTAAAHRAIQKLGALYAGS